ncbi:20504_t:CDS:2 [Racocetra persica]|uniref:20504_t:CDS:1 n=1 Tax=Racocetra persica TaxID=160502 RepID=A0ACA9N0E7_9GLOM|nr:20504_t:CDS:2 [Racocetra persica]
MNYSVSWSYLFEHYNEEIKNDSVDLLNSLVDNIEDEPIDKEGPNIFINKYSDLGSCEIDKNYDWIDDIRQWHPDLDLANVTTFLQQVHNESALNFEA